jgi:hypothetical protein
LEGQLGGVAGLLGEEKATAKDAKECGETLTYDGTTGTTRSEFIPG